MTDTDIPIVKDEPADNSFSMLMKFGKKENLEKLQRGEFYMKNLQYYIDLEKATADEDVGDKYDGLTPINDVKLSIYTLDTHQFFAKDWIYGLYHSTRSIKAMGNYTAEGPSALRSRKGVRRYPFWKRLGNTERCGKAERRKI